MIFSYLGRLLFGSRFPLFPKDEVGVDSKLDSSPTYVKSALSRQESVPISTIVQNVGANSALNTSNTYAYSTLDVNGASVVSSVNRNIGINSNLNSNPIGIKSKLRNTGTAIP